MAYKDVPFAELYRPRVNLSPGLISPASAGGSLINFASPNQGKAWGVVGNPILRLGTPILRIGSPSSLLPSPSLGSLNRVPLPSGVEPVFMLSGDQLSPGKEGSARFR